MCILLIFVIRRNYQLPRKSKERKIGAPDERCRREDSGAFPVLGTGNIYCLLDICVYIVIICWVQRERTRHTNILFLFLGTSDIYCLLIYIVDICWVQRERIHHTYNLFLEYRGRQLQSTS